MALIKCTECGKEISDKAEYCIACGAPTQKKEAVLKTKEEQQNKLKNIVLPLIMLAAFFIILGSLIRDCG